jgi:hypothetical protein
MKRFKELSTGLRLYIATHALVLPWLFWYVGTHCSSVDRWWLDVVLLVVAVVCSICRVELPVFQGQMTVAFAAVCLALLLRGEGTAVLCAALGG